MRGDPTTMQVVRATSAAEAVASAAEAVASAANPSLILAGGTDLMVLWNMGSLNHRKVVDISGVREWQKISSTKSSIQIGSLSTHSQIQSHALVLSHFPLLAQACATVGAVQIQNRGTLGGNLANASPAGDTFPALAVYEASVHAVSQAGARVIPLRDFFAGVKKTSLRAGELICSVELSLPARKPSRQFFRKVGTRAAQAISKTVAAGLLWLNRDGSVADMRFALGSVAPTVRRLTAAEDFLKNKPLSPNVIAEACALVAADISPIDDIRSTRDYRLAVSQNLLKQFLQGKL